MARILLLTDFSEDSLHAAHYAVRLLGIEGNTFRALHVWSDGSLTGPMMPSYGNLVDIWEEDLEGFVQRIRQRAGIEVEGQDLLYGALPPVMDEVVERHAIDLVVMGKHGKGRSLLFGSSAVNVVRSGHAPTLVVPAQASLEPPARIALADDHHPVPPAELALLRRIAIRNRSRVIILHVQETPDEQAGYVTDGSYDIGLKDVPRIYRKVPGKDILEGLGLALGRESADMLVMLHRHIGPLRRIFEPSITKGMVQQGGDLPLLVLHRPKS
ncbi:MAG: universal stress protein [Bacteroidetes bacterium]|nr:universal stress protein [Bacteroidota bacterium]